MSNVRDRQEIEKMRKDVLEKLNKMEASMEIREAFYQTKRGKVCLFLTRLEWGCHEFIDKVFRR